MKLRWLTPSIRSEFFLCPCVGPIPSRGLMLTWSMGRKLALHITFYIQFVLNISATRPTFAINVTLPPTPSILCQCFKQTLVRETGDTKQIRYLFRKLMFNQERLIWKDKIKQYCLMVDHYLQFCITLHVLTMDKPVLRTYAPLKNTMDRTVVTKLNAKLTFPFRKIQTDSRS